MKAVVYQGPHQVGVKDMDHPQIEDPRDVILKVTTAAICGSDMHMYEGRTSAAPGTVFGHEIMGFVDQAGSDVKELRLGDRVVLPFNIGCGFCFNCVRGFPNACLVANPQKPGAAYGYAEMGPYKGGQAEYVRVPFADFNALKLPGEPFDQFEDDFVLLADIFPTGWHSLDLAHFEPGMNVVIFGAGPVGLLAAHSARIRGAAMIFVVDCVKERLDLAKKAGAVPVNFDNGSPVEMIRKVIQDNPLIQQTRRPSEQKIAPLLCGIDAVGYEARDERDPGLENPMQVMSDLVELLDYGGHIGSIGVFNHQDPGAADANAQKGIFSFPLGMLWGKGLTLGTGQTPVKKYNVHQRDLILAGQAKPSFIVSHHISIDEAPKAYQKFDLKQDGYTKVLIQFK